MKTSGSDLFIVDNSDGDWKVRSYLADWCDLSSAIDIATGYFEIGALLCLQEKWQGVDRIRILMGDEVSLRSKRAFAEGLRKSVERLDQSLEGEKQQNDFLEGVPAIVEAIRAGKIQCRVYRKDKFHAKAYIHGTSYQVEPDLAGEEVILWWGLFDSELFIEHGERRFGPYAPVSGPIPLHRFRQFKKSRSQQRADRIENLAGKLVLPRSALAGYESLPLAADSISLKGEAFNRPDPYREVVFPSVLAAKLAIADHLGTPLAKLSPEQVTQINGILNETLDKDEVFSRIRTVFTKYATGEAPC